MGNNFLVTWSSARFEGLKMKKSEEAVISGKGLGK
jgi:hypothetical protein